MRSPEQFLQFLYELNIICYIEDAGDERFFRWCFIERTPSNVSPKVKAEMEYEIHYGLANALNTGKPIRRGRSGEDASPTHPLLDYAKPAATPSQPPKATKPRAGTVVHSTATNAADNSSRAQRQRPSGQQLGTVKWFDSKKGYGFLIQEGIPVDIYFNVSSFPPKTRVKANASVTFELQNDNSGRLVATNIMPVPR